MSLSLKSAVVRVRGVEGEVVGAGFLAAPRLVVTCAHVIADALGAVPLSGADAKWPAPGAELQGVRFDFPFEPGEPPCGGEVVFWDPVRRNPDTGTEAGADIAVVQLTSTSDRLKPVRLVAPGARSVWGHRCRTFGFPAGQDAGVWADGKLLESTGSGWIQLVVPGQAEKASRWSRDSAVARLTGRCIPGAWWGWWLLRPERPGPHRFPGARPGWS